MYATIWVDNGMKLKVGMSREEFDQLLEAWEMGNKDQVTGFRVAYEIVYVAHSHIAAMTYAMKVSL